MASSDPHPDLVGSIMAQDPSLTRKTAVSLASIAERVGEIMTLLERKYSCPSSDPRAAGAKDLAIGAESAMHFGQETIEVSCRVVSQVARMALGLREDGEIEDSGHTVRMQAARVIALAGFRAAMEDEMDSGKENTP